MPANYTKTVDAFIELKPRIHPQRSRSADSIVGRESCRNTSGGRPECMDQYAKCYRFASTVLTTLFDDSDFYEEKIKELQQELLKSVNEIQELLKENLALKKKEIKMLTEAAHFRQKANQCRREANKSLKRMFEILKEDGDLMEETIKMGEEILGKVLPAAEKMIGNEIGETGTSKQ